MPPTATAAPPTPSTESAAIDAPAAEDLRGGERMTLEAFFAYPDWVRDQFDLLQGEVVRRNPPPDEETGMTVRNPYHCNAEDELSTELRLWTRTTDGRFVSLSGEIGVRLTPGSAGVGVDIAVFSAGTFSRDAADKRFLIGVPVVAVEVLSFSDVLGDVAKKRKTYLESGVRQVWSVDPDEETVVVYEAGRRPRLLAGEDTLEGGDVLPGFEVTVADLFPALPFAD